MTVEIPAPVLPDHGTSFDERALAVRDTLTQPRKINNHATAPGRMKQEKTKTEKGQPVPSFVIFVTFC